jgi:hypothetical protein
MELVKGFVCSNMFKIKIDSQQVGRSKLRTVIPRNTINNIIQDR